MSIRRRNMMNKIGGDIPETYIAVDYIYKYGAGGKFNLPYYYNDIAKLKYKGTVKEYALNLFGNNTETCLYIDTNGSILRIWYSKKLIYTNIPKNGIHEVEWDFINNTCTIDGSIFTLATGLGVNPKINNGYGNIYGFSVELRNGNTHNYVMCREKGTYSVQQGKRKVGMYCKELNTFFTDIDTYSIYGFWYGSDL